MNDLYIRQAQATISLYFLCLTTNRCRYHYYYTHKLNLKKNCSKLQCQFNQYLTHATQIAAIFMYTYIHFQPPAGVECCFETFVLNTVTN